MSKIRKGLAIGAFGAAAAVAMGAPASAHGTSDNDGVDLDVQGLFVDVEDTGQVATNNNGDDFYAEGGAGPRGTYAGSDNDLVDVDVQDITALLEDVLQIGVND